MTNIEKVKRILDAGHWVKVTKRNPLVTVTITSYRENSFSHIMYNTLVVNEYKDGFKDCTIEVIQRIPTAYVAGDKVLVLSNPNPNNQEIEDMVGKVCEVKTTDGFNYAVWDEDKTDYCILPTSYLAPVFEEDSLSGKEAKIMIDGKEYSVTLKLI